MYKYIALTFPHPLFNRLFPMEPNKQQLTEEQKNSLRAKFERRGWEVEFTDKHVIITKHGKSEYLSVESFIIPE